MSGQVDKDNYCSGKSINWRTYPQNFIGHEKCMRNCLVGDPQGIKVQKDISTVLRVKMFFF